MTEFTLSTGDPVLLKPAPVKTYRGLLLPGAVFLQAEQAGYVISVHDFALPLYRFSLRRIHCHLGQTFIINEHTKYLRLETVLTGELTIRNPDGIETKLLAGQYRITDSRLYQSSFKALHG